MHQLGDLIIYIRRGRKENYTFLIRHLETYKGCLWCSLSDGSDGQLLRLGQD